jgi:hypothetical protein
MGQGWLGDYSFRRRPCHSAADSIHVCYLLTFLLHGAGFVRVWISAGLPFIYTDDKYNTHFRITQNCNATGPFET